MLSAAEAEGVPGDRISIDFGMARGIAYYTGVLFDIYEGEATSETLGGGGRYDGLTRALGYDRDVPALGFAFNLDAVISSLGDTLVTDDDLTLVSPTESGSMTAAIEKARDLRASGKRAAVDFQNSGTLSSNNETNGQGG